VCPPCGGDDPPWVAPRYRAGRACAVRAMSEVCFSNYTAKVAGRSDTSESSGAAGTLTSTEMEDGSCGRSDGTQDGHGADDGAAHRPWSVPTYKAGAEGAPTGATDAGVEPPPPPPSRQSRPRGR